MFDLFTNSYTQLVQKLLELQKLQTNFSYLLPVLISLIKHVQKCLSLKKQWLWSMKCQVAIIFVHTCKSIPVFSRVIKQTEAVNPNEKHE